ncbi:hypothetical protein Rhopal_005164-T1 [Rhodotorula paludigena]|uniref:Regulator of chromosome condensation 1/beta-lactamase-inhibitor protein II n=1 Tax=Rhodotorula paludigena TaxID=86838 RepID=A0AAV5GSC6_9BASI|nr:hypothetical protein Rhopal_005164-T1 [Rhodotorula paludigena]
MPRPRYSLWAAGSNSHGHLGASHPDDLHRFTRLSLPDGADEPLLVACGANHTLLLARDHAGETRVFVAGSNARGQLASSQDPRLRLSFEALDLADLCDGLEVPLGPNQYRPCEVAASWETSFIVLRSRDGTHSDVVVSLGANDWGERGAANASAVGISVAAIDVAFEASASSTVRVVQLRAGPRHVVALVEVALHVDAEGGNDKNTERFLLGWGASRQGQLGSRPLSEGPLPRITPTPNVVLLPSPYASTNITSVAVGKDHTAVLFGRFAEGLVEEELAWDNVYLFGSDKHGQLGPSNAAGSAKHAASMARIGYHDRPSNRNFLSLKDLLNPSLSPSVDPTTCSFSSVHCTWNGTYVVTAPHRASRDPATAPTPPSTFDILPAVLACGLNSHGQLATSLSSAVSQTGSRSRVSRIHLPPLPEQPSSDSSPAHTPVAPGSSPPRIAGEPSDGASTPVGLSTQTVELACGSEHVLALVSPAAGDRGRVANEVWAWGWNEHGNLGLAAGGTPVAEPRKPGDTEEASLADVWTPTRVWPPSSIHATTAHEQYGTAVRVWAGNATSWILVEDEETDELS